MAATLQRESAGAVDSPSRASRPRAQTEIVLGLAVFGVYVVVNGLSWSGKAASAAAHSRSVWSLERRLHLDPELSLNHWLAPHSVLRVLANYEYATTYVLSAFGLLYWLYRRRPDLYRWARTSFVRLNLVAIACFALYPLRPPRLSPEQGFIDTVRLGHTWGSWGSPLVGHADQLAAMPSLHLGWALWVSAVLARISSRARLQVLSALHVLLTTWVILATANHYLLDAVVALVLVSLCTASVPDHRVERVAAADAFFLHVETANAAQHVGGVVLLDLSTRGGVPPSRAEVVDLVRAELGVLPRFRQVLHEPRPHGWRRPRWRQVEELDWDWHVPLVDLTRADGEPGGRPALDRLVGELAATVLPKDRPLWRLVVVHGVDVDTAAVVLLVHHVVADGVGTVAQALRLLTPRRDQRQWGTVGDPGWWETVRGTAVGLAQLATDGRPRAALPSPPTPERSYATVAVPLRTLRTIARVHAARTDEVVLAAVAGAMARALPDPPAKVRTAVPLMMRAPTSAAEGNVTAAVLMDLPTGAGTEGERLDQVVATSSRLRTPTRALASRWVMQATGAVFPVPLHRWFARTVYGSRFLSAIVSTMPGPSGQLFFLGARLEAAYPLLPPAPGTPVVVGGLGWNGSMCLGISTHPATVEASALADEVRAVLAELSRTPPGNTDDPT